MQMKMVDGFVVMVGDKQKAKYYVNYHYKIITQSYLIIL